MREYQGDTLPGDHDFEDWFPLDIHYRMKERVIELDIGGPAGATEWNLWARFGKVVYQRMYTEWESLFLDGWEPDCILQLIEESSLLDLESHIRTSKFGRFLGFHVGTGGSISEKEIAPPGVQLRAFTLITRSITMQWLCAEVEVSGQLGHDEAVNATPRSRVDQNYGAVPPLARLLSYHEETEVAAEEHALEIAREGLEDDQPD